MYVLGNGVYDLWLLPRDTANLRHSIARERANEMRRRAFESALKRFKKYGMEAEFCTATYNFAPGYCKPGRLCND